MRTIGNDELTIHIPIGDWHEDTLRNETITENKDDVIDLLKSGTPTGAIARSVIVSRELGKAPEDIIAPNKLLLYTGARLAVSNIAAGATHTVDVNGAEYRAQDFIGPVCEAETDADDEDGELFESEVAAIQASDMPTTYTSYTNARAADVAAMYLQRRVPGHVWPRLLTLYEHGRDVRAAVQGLKDELDNMVLRLA